MECVEAEKSNTCIRLTRAIGLVPGKVDNALVAIPPQMYATSILRKTIVCDDIVYAMLNVDPAAFLSISHITVCHKIIVADKHKFRVSAPNAADRIGVK